MNTLHIPTRRARLVTALLLSSAVSSAWAWQPGRMTGGGSIICPPPINRVTFGYELHCQLDNTPISTPNNLEINFSGGDNFHLTELTQAVCTSHGNPAPPAAPFDTMTGQGTGTFNGQAATINFVLVDNGEPGTGDSAQFQINLANGTNVLNCGNNLEGGNNQAHRATGNKP